MKFLNWKQREKISPINVQAGDTIQVNFRDVKGNVKVLIDDKIGRTMVIDEVGIFNAEVDGRDAIGGVIINQK